MMTRRFWFSAVAALFGFVAVQTQACETGFDSPSKLLLRHCRELGLQVKGCQLSLNRRGFWTVEIHAKPFAISTTLPKDTDAHKWASQFQKLLQAPVGVLD